MELDVRWCGRRRAIGSGGADLDVPNSNVPVRLDPVVDLRVQRLVGYSKSVLRKRLTPRELLTAR
jgi:hypothetical protein